MKMRYLPLLNFLSREFFLGERSAPARLSGFKKRRGNPSLMWIASLTLAMTILLAMPRHAHAQCANPVGAAGDVTFNETFNVPQYCDDTNWIAMNGGSTYGPAFDSNAAMCTSNAGGSFTQIGVQSIPNPGTRSVWADSNYVYADGGNNGLYAYSFNGTSFTAAGSVDSGIIYAVWGDGSNIFTAAGTDGLIAYSHDGSNFTEIDRIAASADEVHGIIGDDNYIYAKTGTNANTSIRIEAYSLDGSTLTFLDNYTPASDVRAMCSDNNGYVHVAGNGLLTGLDFDGSTFSLAGSTALIGIGNSIWCDENYIFVGMFSSNRLQAYTFDGSSYTQVASTGVRSIGAMWFDGTHIFLPVEDGGNRDIHAFTFDGSSFTQVDTITTPDAFGPFGVWGDGTYIYAADNVNGIVAYSGFQCLSTASGGISTTTGIVPNGLVGHWRLDETSGTTAYDTSGNGNDGTMAGGLDPTTATLSGTVDNALSFAGGVGQIDIANEASFDFTSSFSFSTWMKVDGFLYQYETVFSKGNVISLERYDYERYMVFHIAGIANSSWSTYEIDDGKWHHVVAVYDAANTDTIIYIDGAEHSRESNASGTPTTDNDLLVLGRHSTVDWRNFSGNLDDVRIYNRALNAAEITEIYNARDGIRYNPSHRTMEYFDGNKHVSMTPEWPNVDVGPIYSSGPNPSCPNVGDACPDGSVYAGITPDGDMPMYTTAINAPGGAAYPWNNGNNTGKVETFVTNDTTGQANTAALVAIDSDSITGGNQPHQAAQYCYDLDIHGKSDWYLPAREEFRLFDGNMVAIGGFTPGGSYYYADSTEGGNGFINAWHQWGANNAGTTGGNPSETSFYVRCVRKGTPVITGTGGLVGHWKLDEISGTTAVDSSGNGNDGTFISAPKWQPNAGAIGGALKFDGVDDILQIANETNFDNGPFSMSLWYTTDGLNSSEQKLIGKFDDGDNSGYYIARNGTGNQLAYRLDGTNTPYRTADTTTLNDPGWQHVVIVYDGTEFGEIYNNGVKDDSNDTLHTGTLTTNNLSLEIGGNTSDSTFWQGMIDDVRFYDRALSTSEIQQLYQMGAPVGSSTALPQGCPNIGDVCDDGMIYAGLSPDGNVEMYTTPEDAPGTYTWNDGDTNYTNATTYDLEQGENNTNTIVITDANNVSGGHQAHPAAQYCYDLVKAGVNDWYLPALDELEMLYNGGDQLSNINTSSRYWSSSEWNTGAPFQQARAFRMDTGVLNNRNKTNTYPIRCVRKGPAPRCANPYGMEGDVVYNTTHDVVQFCDGARWRAIGK